MSEQQKKGRLGEVIRFVVTGGVCFLIEQAVLSLLKEIFGLDVNIGTPIAFLVSVVANYLLCVKWVFPGADGSGGRTKAGFVLTSGIGFFLNWGITFGEPYTVPERANRAVAYANRVDLERNLPKSAKAEEAAEHRGYAVSGHGGMAHEPVQERTRKRGKSIKSMEEENT